MFQQAAAFDQDIEDWDMSKGTDFVSTSDQCLRLQLIISEARNLIEICLSWFFTLLWMAM